MDQVERRGDAGAGQDAHQNRPAHPKRQQHQQHEQSENAHQRDRVAKIAQPDQRSRGGHHQASVLESDQRDEQANARGNPALERRGNGVHNPRPNAGQGDAHKENPCQ